MRLKRFLLVGAIATGLSTMSFAQYGTGTGTGSSGSSSGTYSPPSGGYSPTTGIAAGAGAGAGLALLYFTLHNRGTMVGCVAAADGGLKLVSSGKHDSYTLMGLSAVQPGTKIRVKGNRQTDGNGEKAFLASKLVKEYGPCEK